MKRRFLSFKSLRTYQEPVSKVGFSDRRKSGIWAQILWNNLKTSSFREKVIKKNPEEARGKTLLFFCEIFFVWFFSNLFRWKNAWLHKSIKFDKNHWYEWKNCSPKNKLSEIKASDFARKKNSLWWWLERFSNQVFVEEIFQLAHKN